LFRLSRIFDHSLDVTAVLCGLIVLFGLVSVCAEVVMRYLFSAPIEWVVEVNEYLLVYLTFLGAGWLLRDQGHVRVDVFVKLMRPQAKAAVEVLACIVGALVCLTVVIYGILVTWSAWARGATSATALEIPLALVVVVVPLGALAMMIEFCRRLVRVLGLWRSKDWETVEGMVRYVE
jgi:TRAP-type C4-dicarboxylate transport system permease small subunit